MATHQQKLDQLAKKLDILWNKWDASKDYTKYPVDEHLLKSILTLVRTFFVIRMFFLIGLVIGSLIYTSWLSNAPPEKRDSSYDAWKIWFGTKGMFDYIMSLILTIIILIILRGMISAPAVQQKMKQVANNLADMF